MATITDSLPSASVVAADTTEITVQPVEMELLLSNIKLLNEADFCKVIKHIATETDKRLKNKTKDKSSSSQKKSGSMPKGVVPPQLRKPRAWVAFVHAHALQNGWESFTVFQTKKNKETGEKTEEHIVMSASIMHNGAYVYDGSVSEKTPTGKQLIHKDAMSLSKHYWAPKDSTGSQHPLYLQFEASYVEDVPSSESDDTASDSSSVKNAIVKMTAAEKAAFAEEKKAAKDAEKAEKKATKDAAKTQKKSSVKIPIKATSAPVTTSAPVATSTPITPSTPIAAVKPSKKPVAVTVAPTWTCPADGMVHPWSYKGKNYLRNAENEVWMSSSDQGCGEWQGMYLPAEDRIDDSVAEPVFDE